MYQIDGARESLVGIYVEIHVYLHPFFYFGILGLADVDHHFHRVNLLHGENGKRAGHVAGIIIAGRNHSGNRGHQIGVLHQICILFGLGVELSLELVNALLRAGAYLEQLHGAVIFPLCVVKAHFELVGACGVELHEFLAFGHFGSHIHQDALYAVGRRR